MVQHRDVMASDDDRTRVPSSNSVPQTAIGDLDRGALFPNRWARFRFAIRQPAAEFFGTMILVMFGCGANAQVGLFSNTAVSPTPKGDWLSVAFGWGLGVGLGVWVAGNVSGGHINPAVTLTLATFRGFPWRKVPVYMLAQLLGAILGAAIVYATYFHEINIVEGGRRTVPGTAAFFGTYPVSVITSANVFFDEYIGTFLLVILILAATDTNNMAAPPGLVPLVVFLALFGIGVSFGAQTGFAVNPARDLGPRILTAMAGYGKEVFNYRRQYWLWGGVIAPFLGGLSAGAVYDGFIYTGPDSITNRKNARALETEAALTNGAVNDKGRRVGADAV